MTTTEIEVKYDLPKFARLRRRRDEQLAAIQAASDDYRHWREQRGRLQGLADQNRLTARVSRRSRDEAGRADHDDPGRYLAYNDAELLRRAQAGMAAAGEHREALTNEAAPLRALVLKCEELLRGEGVDLEFLPPPSRLTRPSGPAPAVEDLDELRAQLRDLQGERVRVADAPLSEVEVHAAIDAQLEAAVEAIAEVDTRPLLSGRPAPLFHLGEGGEDAVFALPRNWQRVVGLAVIAGGERLKKHFRSRVAADVEKAGGYGLSAEARKAKLEELDAQIFDLELEEERAICEMESAGISVSRRADADPRAVLAVR